MTTTQRASIIRDNTNDITTELIRTVAPNEIEKEILFPKRIVGHYFINDDGTNVSLQNIASESVPNSLKTIVMIRTRFWFVSSDWMDAFDKYDAYHIPYLKSLILKGTYTPQMENNATGGNSQDYRYSEEACVAMMHDYNTFYTILWSVVHKRTVDQQLLQKHNSLTKGILTCMIEFCLQTATSTDTSLIILIRWMRKFDPIDKDILTRLQEIAIGRRSDTRVVSNPVLFHERFLRAYPFTDRSRGTPEIDTTVTPLFDAFEDPEVLFTDLEKWIEILSNDDALIRDANAALRTAGATDDTSGLRDAEKRKGDTDYAVKLVVEEVFNLLKYNFNGKDETKFISKIVDIIGRNGNGNWMEKFITNMGHGILDIGVVQKVRAEVEERAKTAINAFLRR